MRPQHGAGSDVGPGAGNFARRLKRADGWRPSDRHVPARESDAEARAHDDFWNDDLKPESEGQIDRANLAFYASVGDIISGVRAAHAGYD